MMEWIDKRKRMPAEADCDVQGCVMAWHSLNRCAEPVKLHLFFQYGRYYTHWMPALPAPPEGGAREDMDL